MTGREIPSLDNLIVQIQWNPNVGGGAMFINCEPAPAVVPFAIIVRKTRTSDSSLQATILIVRNHYRE